MIVDVGVNQARQVMIGLGFHSLSSRSSDMRGMGNGSLQVK